MIADRQYDVAIIGTGAGGGTLAAKLAPSGLKILLIERGDFVPREKENWDSHAVVVENRYHVREPWLDRYGKEFHAGTHYFVGGNTKFYGAALFRQQGGEVSLSFPLARGTDVFLTAGRVQGSSSRTNRVLLSIWKSF